MTLSKYIVMGSDGRKVSVDEMTYNLFKWWIDDDFRGRVSA